MLADEPGGGFEVQNACSNHRLAGGEFGRLLVSAASLLLPVVCCCSLSCFFCCCLTFCCFSPDLVFDAGADHWQLSDCSSSASSCYFDSLLGGKLPPLICFLCEKKND